MVVELHRNGKSSHEIGRELSISFDMVRRWIREHKAAGEASFTGNGNALMTANSGK